MYYKDGRTVSTVLKMYSFDSHLYRFNLNYILNISLLNSVFTGYISILCIFRLLNN